MTRHRPCGGLCPIRLLTVRLWRASCADLGQRAALHCSCCEGSGGPSARCAPAPPARRLAAPAHGTPPAAACSRSCEAIAARSGSPHGSRPPPVPAGITGLRLCEDAEHHRDRQLRAQPCTPCALQASRGPVPLPPPSLHPHHGRAGPCRHHRDHRPVQHNDSLAQVVVPASPSAAVGLTLRAESKLHRGIPPAHPDAHIVEVQAAVARRGRVSSCQPAPTHPAPTSVLAAHGPGPLAGADKCNDFPNSMRLCASRSFTPHCLLLHIQARHGAGHAAPRWKASVPTGGCLRTLFALLGRLRIGTPWRPCLEATARRGRHRRPNRCGAAENHWPPAGRSTQGAARLQLSTATRTAIYFRWCRRPRRPRRAGGCPLGQLHPDQVPHPFPEVILAANHLGSATSLWRQLHTDSLRWPPSDHCLGIGSISAVARHCREHGKKLRVLWLDAHADFNTACSRQRQHPRHAGGVPVWLRPAGADRVRRQVPAIKPTWSARSASAPWTRARSASSTSSTVEVFDMRYIDEMGMRQTMEQALAGIDAIPICT